MNEENLKELYDSLDYAITMSNENIKEIENALKQKYLTTSSSKLSHEQKLEHPYNIALKNCKIIYENIEDSEKKNFFTFKLMVFLQREHNHIFRNYLSGKLTDRFINLDDMEFLIEKIFNKDCVQQMIDNKKVNMSNDFFINFLDKILDKLKENTQQKILANLMKKDYVDIRYLPIECILNENLINRTYDVFCNIKNEEQEKYNYIYFVSKKGITFKSNNWIKHYKDFTQQIREAYLKNSLEENKVVVNKKIKI